MADLQNIEKLEDQVVDQTPETNPDVLRIRTDIDAIKKSVDDFDREMADFEQSKKYLVQSIVDEKQKGFEQKRLDIENKKKEVWELITKTRNDIDVLKDEVLKNQAKQELSLYEKELLALRPGEKKSSKSLLGRAWNSMGTGGKWALGIGGGVLAFLGLRKLFRSNEEEEDDEKKTKKKKKKKGIFKKILLRGGGIVGGFLVWKNRDKISDRFKGLFGPPKEERPPEQKPSGDFEGITEEMKKKYYDVANSVDTFAGPGHAASFSEDINKDQEQKGTILFELDKEIGNLSHLNEVGTLDYMQGESSDNIFEKIGSRGKTLLYKVLGGFLSHVTSFQPLGSKFVSNPAEAIQERLKGGAPGEREKQLSEFYKQYMNTLTYVTNKKELILDRKAREVVMGSVDQEPTEDQQDDIKKLREDKDRCDRMLRDVYIADIPALMITYKIEISDVSQDTKDLREKLDEEKKDILQIDDEGESALTRAETDFVDGSLDKSSRDELSEVCQGLGDDMFGKEETVGFFGAYTHLLTDLFDGNEELAKEYMKQMHFDLFINDLQVALETYIIKLKNNTFTQDDFMKFKSQIEAYFDKKAQFTEHTMNIDKSNTGGGLPVGDILNNIFIEPFLDIGKAFGFGKTNSRYERLGRGLGGALVGGGSLYIYGSVARGFGLQMPGKVIQYMGKSCIKIGAAPVTILKKGVTFALGRSYLTGWGWSDAILRPGTKAGEKFFFTAIEQERMIKYAFLRGEISQGRALRLYETIGNHSVTNFDEMLQRFGIADAKHRILFKKYSGSKNIRKLLLVEEKFTSKHREKNVKSMFKDRVLRKDIKINTAHLDELGKIDDFLGRVTHTGKSELVKGFLETTKSLKPDMIQELFATQTFDKLAPEASKDIGRLLGRNMHKFSSLDDFKAFQAFFARNYPSNPSRTFVSNVLSKWKIIKTMDQAAQTKYIETGKLNTTFLQRRIAAMKDNFRKSAETLRRLVTGKKTPYPQGVSSVANNLDEIAKVPDEDLALIAEGQRIGNGKWISAMSGNSTLIKQLSPLFKDKKFLDALSKAKTPQAVKDLFVAKGINNVPEEFATTLSKTTNTRKLADTMRYVEKYETLGKIGKILQKPAMKYAARIVGRVFVVGTLIIGGVCAYDTYKEGSRIAKTNKERGELMQAESFVDIGLTLAGACAFVPGVGWIAAGVILIVTTVASIAKEYLFDTLDKYERNYKDFAYSSSMLIKQHILTTTLGSAGEDIGFGDFLLTSGPGMQAIVKQLAAKTGSEATKALLYVEERKKNPLAMIDIDDTELMAKLAKEMPPITREQIAVAKDEVDKNVTIRYEYLKKKCGVYASPKGESFINIQKIVSVDKIKNEEGLKLLDKLMLESEYALVNPELYGDSQQIEQQQKETKNVLDQDKPRFALLEKLFAKDKQSMLYMYRYANEYRQHLEQFGFDENGVCIESEYDAILKNMEYFDAYMKFKTLDQGIDVISQSLGFVEPNFITTRNFFVGLILDKPIAEKEMYASSNKLQTILYRIATEVIGVQIGNTMEDIKSVFDESNEQAYGIYFDEGRLNVNGNYFGDNEYAGNDTETIKRIRQDIQEQINATDLIDIGTGDTYLNKEIGNKYLAIIDQELARN